MKNSAQSPFRISLMVITSIGLIAICALVWLLPYVDAVVRAAPADPGPQLSIPSNIPAQRNSIVDVPVSFAANGYQVSAVVFAIDYDQTYLYYDATVPNGITLSLPAGFVGACSPDLADTNGEIKCFINYPIAPQQALSDGVLVNVKLRTLNPTSGVSARAGFSATSPPASFGSTSGQSIPGETYDGSVMIGSGGSYQLKLPLVVRLLGSTPSVTQTPTPTATTPPGGCQEVVQNGGFEYTGVWTLPATLYTARYTTLQKHSGARSLQTGIVNLYDQIYSYSSGYQYVTIPYDVNTARLEFWYYPVSGDAPYGKESARQLAPPELKLEGDQLVLAPDTDDAQYVILFDENNNELARVLWTLSDTRTWTYHQYNLLQYRGRTLKLYIGTYNDGYGGVTAMFTDDVSVQVCW